MSDGLRRNTMLGSPSSNNSGGGGTTTSGSYTVNLNGQWELTTTPANPDSALYDGVYRSASNYNVNNGVAIMYITIKDCSSFKIYIRSYAESNYDYVMISHLDLTIDGNTSYSNTALVKAHTRGNQQSGTALSSYTLVEYTGITSGEHTITVVYRKDSSVNNGDDRGYVLIPKLQSGGDFEEDGGSDEGPIDINNYLTIEALENGLTAKLSINACEYCIDGDGVWYTLTADNYTPSINQGQVISFRGNLTPSSSNGIGTFTISKKCNLKGNCMSMLFGNNAENNYSLSGKEYGFYKLFYNCTNIINVSPNFLPATTICNYGYIHTFENCSNIRSDVYLNIPYINTYSCPYMYSGCSNIQNVLNLYTDSSGIYDNMFSGCSRLRYVKLTISKKSGYSNPFRNFLNDIHTNGILFKKSSISVLGVNGGSTNVPDTWIVINDDTDFIPYICNSLSIKPATPYITSPETRALIEYTANVSDINGNTKELVGYAYTHEFYNFEENTTTQNIDRIVGFTFLHQDAETIVKHHGTNSPYFKVAHDGHWKIATSLVNPDLSKYEGIYLSDELEEWGSYSASINTYGCSMLNLYICNNNSTAYCRFLVSNLDKQFTSSNDYKNSEITKYYTTVNTGSKESLDGYIKLTYFIDDAENHTINLMIIKETTYSDVCRGAFLVERIYKEEDSIFPLNLSITEVNTNYVGSYILYSNNTTMQLLEYIENNIDGMVIEFDDVFTINGMRVLSATLEGKLYRCELSSSSYDCEIMCKNSGLYNKGDIILYDYSGYA